MQPEPARARALREGGDPRGGRHARRVQHDLRLRRRLDGDDRHARVADFPRGDRRLDRARRRRASVRRPRLPRRLRQDDPRRGDGARAPRHPRPRLLRRLDRSRTLPRQRRHDPGRLRSGGRARRRPHDRRGRARARELRVPRRRCMRRPVHREHDGAGDRLPRHLAARPLRDSGAGSRQGAGGVRGREDGDGRRPQGHPPLADPHPRGIRKRDRIRRRHRRLRRTASSICSRSRARPGSSSSSRTSTRSPRARRSSPT